MSSCDTRSLPSFLGLVVVFAVSFVCVCCQSLALFCRRGKQQVPPFPACVPPDSAGCFVVCTAVSQLLCTLLGAMALSRSRRRAGSDSDLVELPPPSIKPKRTAARRKTVRNIVVVAKCRCTRVRRSEFLLCLAARLYVYCVHVCKTTATTVMIVLLFPRFKSHLGWIYPFRLTTWHFAT